MEKELKKIMLVDDSPVIQTLVKKIFYGLGIEVIGLKTGASVIKTLEENEIDAVVMDIILPDADGMDLAKLIRKLKNRQKANVPIVAISGNYKNYTQTDFDQLGIEYYLIKPLDYDKLVQVVKKSLK